MDASNPILPISEPGQAKFKTKAQPKSRLEPDPPPEKPYPEALFQYTFSKPSCPPHFLDFTLLYKLRLNHLQTSLAKLSSEINTTGKASPSALIVLKSLLEEHSKALRDYEYVSNLPLCTPFQTKQHLQSLTTSLNSLTSLAHPTLQFQKLSDSTGDSFQELTNLPNSILNSLQSNNGVIDLFARFFMASIFMSSLLTPVIIMIYNPSTDSSLKVTWIAIGIFAFFAFFACLMPGFALKDSFVVVAAYAAILVVFVGTSLSNSGGVCVCEGGNSTAT